MSRFILAIFLFLALSTPLEAARPFALLTGPDWKGEAEMSLSINPPAEFDQLTKEEVMNVRRKMVEQHSDWLAGKYEYSPDVFGQIQDGKPWWGLKGQFCIGPGEKSIEGPSEESRYLLNPFVLLALDAPTAFINKDPACFPANPFPPRSVKWFPVRKEFVIVYDLSRYFAECQALHGKFCGYTLFVDALNARDFGFNYIQYDRRFNRGMSPAEENNAFDQAFQFKNFIHVGQSCGYPGGCNNSSPEQKQMYVRVDYLPAQLMANLWYEKPVNLQQAPDVKVRFILE